MVKEDSRNYGIDLFRIISMVMIVMFHVLLHGGVVKNAEFFSLHYEIAWLMHIFCYGAVDIYALISGYVGISANWKLSNIIMLYLKVLFYTLIITVLFFALGNIPVNFSNILKAICPLITKGYWYFNAYVGMYFFIPLLNKAVKEIDGQVMLKLLGGLFIIQSIIPTFSTEDVFSNGWGFSTIWLMLLYLVGATIKKNEDVFEKITVKRGFILASALFFVTWILKFILEFMTLKFFGTPRGSYVFVSYVSPTIVLASVCLLITFSKVKIKENFQKSIFKFSTATFGVYLIHDNYFIREYWIKDRFLGILNLNIISFIMMILMSTFGIYVLSTIIEMTREWIFNKINIKSKIQKILEFCKFENSNEGKYKIKQRLIVKK